MKKSIAKNTIYSILLRVFNIIVPIIIGAYPLRIFGPDLMGRVAYSESIYSVFLIFAAFGVYNYALREISKVRDDRKKLNQSFTSLFVLETITHVIVSAVYFIYVFINFRDKPQFVVLLVYGVVMLQDCFYIEWVNEALENYDFITKKSIIVRIIVIILLLTLVKSKNDFYIYVLLIALPWFLNNGASFIYIKRSVKFDFSNLKLAKHIKPLLVTMLISNSYLLYTQFDKIMLGRYISEAQVGFYNVSQSIIMMINPMLLSIVYVTIPRLSNISESSEEQYLSLLDRVSKFYFAFMFPAAVGISVLANEIIVLYAGQSYAPAGPVLRMFSIFLISMGIESILTNQIIYVKRKEKFLGACLFVTGTLDIGLKFLLLTLGRLNPVTAIATTTVCNFIFITLEYIYVRKHLKVAFNLVHIGRLKYLFISLLIIPITYVIKIFIHRLIFIILFAVSVNAIIYFVVLLLVKDESVITILNKLSLLVRRKK